MEGHKNFTITDIHWENMFLDIEVASDLDLQYDTESISFTLRKITNESDSIRLTYNSFDNNTYYFKMNISQMDERAFLDNGEWELEAEISGSTAPILVKPEVAYKFSDLSRVFRYEAGKAYVISFKVNSFATDRNDLLMTIESTFMTENKDWRNKKTGIKDTVIKALHGITDMTKAPHKGHVLFLTETNDHISGNLKLIYEGLKKEAYATDYRISVYARNDVKLGLGIKRLFALTHLIADQDMILVDDYAPVFSYIDPPKGCRLVQLWHANVGFKSVGYSRFGRDGSPHPEWSCHRKYTDVFVPHKDMIDTYREVFGVEKEAFRVLGCPKLDGFAEEELSGSVAKGLREKFPVLKGKRVILFAPTYRGTGEQDAFYDYSALNLKRLYETIGGHSVLVFKMHPFISKHISIPKEFKNRMVDMSDYPDITELYHVTDLLITDYSSDYFEYALLRKPVIFYTYDRDVYQLTRGVHRDVKEHAPGKVCDTFDELIETLKNQDYELNKTRQFADEYSSMLDVDSIQLMLKDLFGE